MAALTKEAVSLLRKVRLHILAEPKRLNMAQWIRLKGNSKKQRDSFARNTPFYPYAKCGTAACIAGWTVLLHDGKEAEKLPYSEVSNRATKLLGREHTPFDLFYVDEWDIKWEAKYRKTTTPAEKAKVAGAYINHYIKTRSGNAKALRDVRQNV